jgi:hypothetical protein
MMMQTAAMTTIMAAVHTRGQALPNKTEKNNEDSDEKLNKTERSGGNTTHKTGEKTGIKARHEDGYRQMA